MGRTRVVALLLFCSGACSLIYQTAWLRELRLVFGASTAATAAVLAIFMGGLGLGSAILGRRADQTPEPLKFYAYLELLLAAAAAATPGLFALVRVLYLVIGGSSVLGGAGATLIRIILSALVLLIPTALMGGTLPAAARAVEEQSDQARRRFGSAYGANTLGAVAGTLISVLYLLEHLGNRRTVWAAALLNLAIGCAAIMLNARWRSHFAGQAAGTADKDLSAEQPTSVIVRRFTFAAAGLSGFVFFLMEIVWYRMLAPLLGGTVFAFGIVLAAALAGIGVGGALYSLRDRSRPASLRGYSLAVALQAFVLALPYAAGDRIAVLALLLRSLGAFGFGGFVAGWAVIAAIVVFPAAIAAGFQFPLLISLLGRGDAGVGNDVGFAYAWNTAGAVAGAIIGGFGLLPLLGAPLCWKAATVILVALAICALVADGFSTRRFFRLGMASLAIAATLPLLFARGPTAAWRHSAIGAGRVERYALSANGLIDWIHHQRRVLVWEEDGIESSIALIKDDGYAFVVNGKVDGHTRWDAPTQVMLGMVGAILHSRPRRAFVVGLGTGTTAGWLAMVPTMERVDVAEIEPSVVRVARAAALVNHNALNDARVRIHFGDGRELLMTSRETYDLICSEPSNPYRAGIANLYTSDFYRGASRRLDRHGIFLQWVQAYEIAPETLGSIYRSMLSAFPYVETWETEANDLLLVASFEPQSRDLPWLRQRVSEEPFRTALRRVWRVDDVEGFVAHHLAGMRTAEELAAKAPMNTDDRTIVEFGFARTVGRQNVGVSLVDLKALATSMHDDDLTLTGGSLESKSVQSRRFSMTSSLGDAPLIHSLLTPEMVARARIHVHYLNGNYRDVLGGWVEQKSPISDPMDTLTIADAQADQGSESAMMFVPRIHEIEPIEADVVVARLRWKEGRVKDAVDVLERALLAYRNDPWPLKFVMERALEMTAPLAAADPSGAASKRLVDALSQPFVLQLLDDRRNETRLYLSRTLDNPQRCSEISIAALHAFEPSVPWRRDFLEYRARCYAQWDDGRAAAAKKDLARFEAREVRSLRDVVSESAATVGSAAN